MFDTQLGKAPFKEKYDNFVGGDWREPASGAYFDNVSPLTGEVVGRIARSNAEDVEAALDAAHRAAPAWGRTSYAERALILMLSDNHADRCRRPRWPAASGAGRA